MKLPPARQWMERLKRAGKKKSASDVASVCQEFEQDLALSQSMMLAAGPLGKACRLLDVWLVEEVQRYTQQPLTTKALEELFVAAPVKPSFASKDTEVMWEERVQRKKARILEFLAPQIDENPELKTFALRQLITDWHEAVPSFPLRDGVALVHRWLPPDQTLASLSTEAPGDLTALQWAWDAKHPGAAEGLVALGQPLFGSPADQGWSLAQELLACHETRSPLLEREGWKRLLAQALSTQMENAWDNPSSSSSSRPRL